MNLSICATEKKFIKLAEKINEKKIKLNKLAADIHNSGYRCPGCNSRLSNTLAVDILDMLPYNRMYQDTGNKSFE